MTVLSLLRKSLRHYWRTNLAVIAGVAIAVSVLAGALLVGDSVRGSLKDLFLGRLGRTSYVLSASHFFPEDVSSRIDGNPEFRKGFENLCPLAVIQGVVTHQENRRRASDVQVYGVDEHFWQFHHQSDTVSFAMTQREALVSPSLANEVGIQPGDSVLLRLEAPSDIPAESLHGRKENRGRTVRLVARRVLPSGGLSEFSLRAEQQSVKAIFVPLGRLQRELGQEGRVNTVLVAEQPAGEKKSSLPSTDSRHKLEEIVRQETTLEDMGVQLRLLQEPAPQPGSPSVDCLSLEQASTLLDEALVAKAREAAKSCGLTPMPILTYLANRIRVGTRAVPYSLVGAVEANVVQSLVPDKPRNVTSPIWVNEWAASDLNARVGDKVTLEYYVWRDEGQLVTEESEFQLAGIVPNRGIAADRNLVPKYPGISDSDTLSDWDPPFPMDLGLIRPKDEAYWKQYRATPKAFIVLSDGQKLWRSRFGVLTSMRLKVWDGDGASLAELRARGEKFRHALSTSLSPFESGFGLLPVKAQGLAASRGATDFGEYFTYFSFFLVASAFLLATLFFRLGVEQRLREVGLLKALGFAPKQIRRVFLLEGLFLASAGSIAGAFGAMAYGYLMMMLLRTWWVGAVGTRELSLHVAAGSLIAGVVGGILSATGCIAWTLSRLVPTSARSLLAGVWVSPEPSQPWEPRRIARLWSNRVSSSSAGAPAPRPVSRPAKVAAVGFCLFGGMLLIGAATARLSQAAGFFGAGISFLISLLCFQAVQLRRRPRHSRKATGVSTLWQLGVRQASDRPGRSVLCIALIASATFIIVAVDAFRRDRAILQQPPSGTGGYALMGQSLLPILQNWNSSESRDALGFSQQDSALWKGTAVVRFRVRPGEDTSCLNLFRPGKPRILAPERGYPPAGRFLFKDSLAQTEEEKHNPWRLLERSFPDGAVPVIGDANSLSYVLHRKVGEDWLLEREGREPLRLRIVAALDDSLFQGELLISEDNFKRLFPEQQGYRFFLFDVPLAQASAFSQRLEDRLADEGLDVTSTEERLAGFHRVENTYLSTFQFLGGLGLFLGTFGLAVVLLRNVLERRRELAVLRAVGYTKQHLGTMVLAENAFLLVCGVATGLVCALLAILPAMASRSWNFVSGSLGWLLGAVFAAGLLASVIAMRAALRGPLLASLRSE